MAAEDASGRRFGRGRAMALALGVAAVVAIVVAVVMTLRSRRLPGSALANGAFRDVHEGMPVGWHPVVWADDRTRFEPVAGEEGGSGVLRITNVEPNDARLCQTIDLDPATTYRISADVRTEDVGIGAAGALIAIEPRVTDSRDVRGTQPWQRLQVTVAANGAARWDVCLRLGSYGSLNTGTAFFRDVRVDAIARALRRYATVPTNPVSFLRFVLFSPVTAALAGGVLLAFGLGILGGRRG
jgi:hypothetical protein